METKMTESRHLYSWWWDSHISPKNSKWLQENLTDIDSKVKSMIKIINEDADSFARRAEMYYKKRPELMKLVEEFYRAYRALADRYDHATGELRLAHRTMIEAFPNQVPFMVTDDEMFHSGEATIREEDKDSIFMEKNHGLDLRTMILNESDRAAKAEAEMQRLRLALAKMEAERDSALAQYKQILEKLAHLENELSSAKNAVDELGKCAYEAQSEVKAVKDALVQHKQSLEKISVLEEKLKVAEENADGLMQQKEEAVSEVKCLKEEIERLNKEKEYAYLQYQHCLEMVSKLQNELTEVKEEARRLKGSEEKWEVEIAVKDQEIFEKDTALEKIMTRLDDERSRFMEVESSLHELQNMHFQLQEEQGRRKGLEVEVQLLREENRGLNELKLASGAVEKDMENEIMGLKEITKKLEEEVTRQANQFCQLKQESEDLYKKNEDLLNRVASDEEKMQNEALLRKVEALQESCKSLGGDKLNLMAEKSALLSQLQIITEAMQKLLEKNVLLENSLQSAYIEVEGLRVKSKGLEDFCRFLKDEKSRLESERSRLVYRLECVEKSLERLETRFAKLECSKNEEGAKYSERLVFELESKNMMQQLETEYYLGRAENLRRAIFRVLEAVGIGYVSGSDPEVLLKEIKRSLLKSKDENQELLIQNNVFSTVIQDSVFLLNKQNVMLLQENRQLGLKHESLKKELIHTEEEMCLQQEAYNSLGEKYVLKEKEMVLLQEANRKLETEVRVLNQEAESCRVREVVLNTEHELWEAEATSFYIDLQMGSVREGLLEDKVREASRVCEDLKEEGKRRSMEIERLTSELAGYAPVVIALKENVASLEKSSALQIKESESFTISNSLKDLQALQSRIKAIDALIVKKKQKSRNNSQSNVTLHDSNQKAELRNGIHMKDIPLDHVSEGSPSRTRRRKSSRLSDQLLELWEASDIDSSNSLASSSKTRGRFSPPRRNAGEIEKELGVDKLELTKSNQGANKTIILERLASDGQKLTSLQISVQELRRKIEIGKKGKIVKESEFKSLRSQILSVENSVIQLVGMNAELVKTVKGSGSREIVEVEQVLKRKILEQSRRDSEKIGSLQLEMQKIQSLLGKVEEEKKGMKKGGKKGIILREFVYGPLRIKKQKKPRFCGCFKQSQKEV